MEFDTFVASLKPITKIVMAGILIEAALISFKVVYPINFIMAFPTQFHHVRSSDLEIHNNALLQWKTRHFADF